MGIDDRTGDTTPIDTVVVYELRLPCGHLVTQPTTNSNHVVCNFDLRKWHLFKKGIEWCAREEY